MNLAYANWKLHNTSRLSLLSFFSLTMSHFCLDQVYRNLPLATFDQLCSLLQVVVEQGTASDASRAIRSPLILTEAALLGCDFTSNEVPERFMLVVSEAFSALLVGSLVPPNLNPWAPLESSQNQCSVELTFDPATIAPFLTTLQTRLQSDSYAQGLLHDAHQMLRPNQPYLQSELTLRLVELLAASTSASSPTSETNLPLQSFPILSQLTSQIYHNLALSSILEATAQQALQTLRVDRVLLYQLDWKLTDQEEMPVSTCLCDVHGCVIHEARANNTIPLVKDVAELHRDFAHVSYASRYRQGVPLTVVDTESAYIFSPDILDLMRCYQVRAELIVPVVVQSKLWGLIIVQHTQPRLWLSAEVTLLQRVAEGLAIAIHQAQLLTLVQQQQQMLEQQASTLTYELQNAFMIAQSANRTKSEFIATMSHELRTPLTCVIGLSEALLRWSFGPLSHKQQQYLQTIHNSGEHLLTLINDILELREIEAGKAVLDRHEFCIAKLATTSLQLLRQQSNDKGMTLELDLSRLSELPTYIQADRRRVELILFNLLSNAVKFTPQGGKVFLRVWLEEAVVVLQVEDTGIGIPEQQHALLFEKFQQLDPSYQRQYEGTGLGLALTKELVEVHGGWIKVESTIGQGSTFTVYLPTSTMGQTDRGDLTNTDYACSLRLNPTSITVG